MLPALIEKDFWVCWTLRRMFSLENPSAGFIFKGGTSLSKVFRAIDRFSEDVDLSFDRAALGFGGDQDPTKAASKTQTAKRLEKLSETCRQMIRAKFMPQLEAAFAQALGAAPSKKTWWIELDPDDPDQQTLAFHYPVIDRVASGARYSKPAVRLELGARGEQWPADWSTVTPYAAEVIPKPFKDPVCKVRALAAERTFWEKATILHVLFHYPPGKKLGERQSRHYYDLSRLYTQDAGKRALSDLGLLKNVVEHKAVFFASTAARYDLAVPGSLRLVPHAALKKELAEDYAKMREMIFGDPPPFDEVLAAIGEIERRINAGN